MKTQRALKRPSKRQRQRALAHLPELNRPMAEYGLPSMAELERLSQSQAAAPIGAAVSADASGSQDENDKRAGAQPPRRSKE